MRQIDISNFSRPADLVQQLNLTHLVGIIKTILVDKEALSILAKRSYHHDNGFDKIPLYVPSEPSFKLRLHIWWPEVTAHMENIHNHRWTFSSKILTGQLTMENWQEQPTDTLFSEEVVRKPEYRYTPRAYNQYYSMQFVGFKPLLKTQTVTLCSGASYEMHHSQLHRATGTQKGLTSTIMFQHAAVKNFTTVFPDHEIDNIRKIDSRHFSARELKLKLEYYIGLVEHNSTTQGESTCH